MRRTTLRWDKKWLALCEFQVQSQGHPRENQPAANVTPYPLRSRRSSFPRHLMNLLANTKMRPRRNIGTAHKIATPSSKLKSRWRGQSEDDKVRAKSSHPKPSEIRPIPPPLTMKNGIECLPRSIMAVAIKQHSTFSMDQRGWDGGPWPSSGLFGQFASLRRERRWLGRPSGPAVVRVGKPARSNGPGQVACGTLAQTWSRRPDSNRRPAVYEKVGKAFLVGRECPRLYSF